MARTSRRLTLLLGLCALAAQAVGDPARSGEVEAPHIRAELFSDADRVAPGDTLTLALRLQPDEGWHTYWMNPGDSGLETRIDWTLPDGAEAGPIQWPVPDRLPVEHLVNYGFEGETLLLSDITLPLEIAQDDSVTLTAQARWLVCEVECIPGDAELSLTLPVGDITDLSAHTALFQRARARQPQAADWPAAFSIEATWLEVTVAPDRPLTPPLQFFPGTTELVEHAENQQFSTDEHGNLIIRQPLNVYFHTTPAQFPAVLRDANGAWSLTVGGTEAPPTGEDRADSATDTVPTRLLALLLAFGGGVLLNLMPCVFPVLSLKALGLARHGGHRGHALAYTAGVLACFLVIAALLLALRAGGAALGWGFQLQTPMVVGGLAYLMFALGLALMGVVQLGAGWMGAGETLTRDTGLRGSFFTGVLAVVVASPCTAPFMGTALGFAVTQPAPVALGIFAALGLGLAFPFLLIGFVPALARRLPKPGPWMGIFRQAMAFPLFLTGVWLLWVLGRQVGIDGLTFALAGLVVLALGLWLWGLGQHGRQRLRLAAALVMLAALWPLWQASGQQATIAVTADDDRWTPQRLAALRAAGEPVLVNMTADWCITCLANERVALDTDMVRAALTDGGVSYLKGDWTRQDPDITEYLAGYGRNGVPLYVLYPRGGGAPQVLPQVLTPTLVRDAVSRAANP
ncbi:protein-disulfide reductase DsbD family protein [Isoalcanivorax indicus]|uniref:protein-disulfide reductase DsbD family protein n=1 Tax=Isoalcanivorax indicus TaxID=2202653 RepID=UPI000DBAC67B|nr:protein-disulfide reductase DsbD domain-containing protein [Isoalcanivorax indicus]